MAKVFKSKIFLGAVCLLLAAVLAFVALPSFYSSKSETTEVTTTLDLPADMNELVKAMERVGAASWEEVIFTVEDSAIPGFPEDLYGN